MAHIANWWDAVKNILNNNRVKSFFWRTGMMILAVIIQQVIDSMSGWQVSGGATVVLGLVLGELSKAINMALQGK